MDAIRFRTTIGSDRLIRPPSDVQLAPGEADVVVVRKIRPDKSLALHRLHLVTVITDRGISLAFTGDHHFAQAEFQLAFP